MKRFSALKKWISVPVLLLTFVFCCPLERASAQANPPSGKPVQYAAPFGVMTWINAEDNSGVGAWKLSSGALNISMIPSTSGQLDELGNSYFALLDLQDSNNNEHNAQYFAYVSSSTLTLRLKPGSAGTSPFSILASAVLRNVSSLDVGENVQLNVSDGGGYGNGWAGWASSRSPSFFHQVDIVANTDGGDSLDSEGSLYFGVMNDYPILGLEESGNSQRLYLTADGSLRAGEVLAGNAILPADSVLATTDIPNIAVKAAGMESIYMGPDGTQLVWNDVNMWVATIDENNGNTLEIYLEMSSEMTGKLIVNYNGSFGRIYDVTRDTDGALNSQGDAYYGPWAEAASLLPLSLLNAPIQSFQFNGQTFQINNQYYEAHPSSAPGEASAQVITTYQSGNGSTSQLNWNPFAGRMLTWNSYPGSMRLTVYAPEGTAIYTPDESGNYILDEGSSTTNALTRVNGAAFVINGNTSSPFSGPSDTQFLGDLDVRGNILTLGGWLDNPNQSALTMAYQDGNSSGSPATATWIGSRPNTQWLWRRATGSGPETVSMMKLGADHVLTLYKSDGSAGGISMNPDTGRIRIAPQGDLSMGTFVSEPTP